MGQVFDKRGIPIERGDIVKVFHFIGPKGKRHYMYKQCLGVGTYPRGTAQYLMFSHLNFNEEVGSSDGPYHEHLDDQLRPAYEIVQSIKCDHETRPRRALIESQSP